MAKRTTYVSPAPPDSESDPYREKGLQFTRALNSLLLKKGWNQAELARRATMAAAPGVRLNRQRINSYMKRGHLPSQLALEAIAKALGVATSSLVPPSQADFLGQPFNMQTNGAQARVKLDLTVSMADALKIAEIAQKYTL